MRHGRLLSVALRSGCWLCSARGTIPSALSYVPTWYWQRERASSAALLPAIRLTRLPPPCGRMRPSAPRAMTPSVSPLVAATEKARRPAAAAAASAGMPLWRRGPWRRVVRGGRFIQRWTSCQAVDCRRAETVASLPLLPPTARRQLPGGSGRPCTGADGSQRYPHLQQRLQGAGRQLAKARDHGGSLKLPGCLLAFRATQTAGWMSPIGVRQQMR